MNTNTESPATVREVLLEITIRAPRERVWQALVEETSAWWHKDFFTRPAEGFHIQPKLGGWMYEDWGKGNGLIWGTVSGVCAPEMLQVVGDLNADWGGPHRGIMDWTLTEDDADPGKTHVRSRHGLFGNISEKTAASLDGGWRMLFEGCLKPHAETS